MTKTHWKTLPPWEELCAEILAEMEADALSSPDNVPSKVEIPKEFDDWDRRGRLIPWGSDMSELAIDEEDHDDAADNQPPDPDGVIDRAIDLLKMGCLMPSCQISSEHDLTTTPTALRNGKSGGIRLWSYQLAAMGRMESMLEQDCAVLASLRSVSCVVQRSLYLLTRTSIPLADGYDGPRGRRRRGTILVIVPLPLMSNWYWVCVYSKSSLRFFSQRLLTKDPDDGMLNGSPTSTNYTECQLRTYGVVLTTYNIIRLQHVAMRDTKGEIAVWLRNQHKEKEYRPKPRKMDILPSGGVN
jgi:hypothetical protein